MRGRPKGPFHMSYVCFTLLFLQKQSASRGHINIIIGVCIAGVLCISEASFMAAHLFSILVLYFDLFYRDGPF